MGEVAAARRALPVAGLDRRFYAFVLDRLLTAVVYAGAGFAVWRLAFEADRPWLGATVLVLTVLGVTAGSAVFQGLTGTTPGKAALGLRTVDVETGLPVGVWPGLVRGVVLGVAGVPTFGLGLAALALTALGDPERRRRGWHDRLTAAMVVDVRPAPPERVPEPALWQPVVNLTAARLVPGPTAGPALREPTAEAVGAASSTPAVPPGGASRGEQTVVRRPEMTARWRLVFDTGEQVVVEGPGLVGRGPAPHDGEQVRHLVPLRSRDMSLSKTHAQFHLADDALVVMDRGSTNGTVLIRQGVSRELSEGRPATLLDGDRVRFGDREMTVRRDA